MNADAYTHHKETVDVLSDSALMSQIAENRTFDRSNRKGLPFVDVFGKSLAPMKDRRTV